MLQLSYIRDVLNCDVSQLQSLSLVDVNLGT
jgi:hypothetical protein